MTTGKELVGGEGPEKTQQQSELPTVRPPVDIYENDQEILLVADFPAVDPDDVDVRLESGQLDIEGRQSQPTAPGDALPPLMFARSFRVPDTIDPATVNAELKAGVLFIHLRKSEQAKPRKIRVTSG
jgi:HSP20 family molecular chaperone IbpA